MKKAWKAIVLRFQAASMVLLLGLLMMGAVIQSGATSDNWTIDPTSKAGRVTLYDSTGREVSSQSKATYSAASGVYTPPATPTDSFCIFGSASKTVRVVSFSNSNLQTTAGINLWVVAKRSTADTAGTPVAATRVPHDSDDAAATATVSHYTANPTTGSLIGNVRSERVLAPAAGSVVGPVTYDFLAFGAATLLDRPVTLRGTGEGLCLNFAGAALPAGSTWAGNVTWTEE